MDYGNLPDLALIEVFKKLDVSTFRNAHLVSKHWYNVASSSSMDSYKQERIDIVKLKFVSPFINRYWDARTAKFKAEFGVTNNDSIYIAMNIVSNSEARRKLIEFEHEKCDFNDITKEPEVVCVKLNDSFLRYLVQFPLLCRLDLTGVSMVSEYTFTLLVTECPNIFDFTLTINPETAEDRNEVGADPFALIGDWKELKRLKLSFHSNGLTSASSIAKFSNSNPKLEKLHLFLCEDNFSDSLCELVLANKSTIVDLNLKMIDCVPRMLEVMMQCSILFEANIDFRQLTGIFGGRGDTMTFHHLIHSYYYIPDPEKKLDLRVRHSYEIENHCSNECGGYGRQCMLDESDDKTEPSCPCVVEIKNRFAQTEEFKKEFTSLLQSFRTKYDKNFELSFTVKCYSPSDETRTFFL